MASNGCNAEIHLDQLAGIASFIVAVDERLKITWASRPVMTRVENAIGLEISDIVEYVEPPTGISLSSITETLGERHRILIKGTDSSTPLVGRWILSSSGFILLANPDLVVQDDFSKFSFDDFTEENYSIELLTTREEHAMALQKARSAAQELSQAKRHLEGVFSTMAEGLIVIAPDGKITEANPTAERILGLDRAEIERINYNRPIWDIFRPDGTPMPIHEMAGHRAKQERRPVKNVEMGVKRPDDTVFWVNASAAPLINAEGELECVVCGFSDITEHKKAEEEVLKSEAFQRALIDTSPDFIFVLEANGIIRQTNRVYPGHSREDVVGKRASMFIPPEYRGAFERAVRQAIDTGRLQAVESAVDLPDGRHYFLCRINPVSLVDEESSIVLISTDITDRTLVEEKLSQSEQLFRMTLDCAGDMIFSVLPDEFVEYMNYRAKAHFEMEEIDVLNSKIPLSFFWCGESIDQVQSSFKKAIRTRKPVSIVCRCDESNYELRLTPVIRFEGVYRVVCVARDITKRVAAEKELLRMNEHLEHQTTLATSMASQAETANTAKNEFLANIRTPIDGVIDTTSLLLDTELSSDQRHYAETVKASADSLLGLINDILDFAKIEAGKLKMETLDFDLRSLLDDFVDMMARGADEKGLELLCSAAPEVPAFLQGDPSRLRQVLTNLAANATKFTNEGEIAVRADLESETEKEAVVRFSVRDTGIGIPANSQDNLFQQFMQVDASASRKYGTGLGLAISKRLAEAMGGEIGVTSEEGQGSEFWFTARFIKQSDRTDGPSA
ncbi:MAG: PAS domain S-box protein [Deltaproteobacteria bacterium]|nr:PAS domain S-box protein [Deltaproteobacteria bacterium]